MSEFREQERCYTTEEVAKRYGVSVQTVQRWVRSGRLSGINLSGGPYGPYRFTPKDLEDFEALGRMSKAAAGAT